ncbi:MAG: hypothetical protein ACTSYA_01530 [Candidatus Kariarchaeaceae archaeon]
MDRRTRRTAGGGNRYSRDSRRIMGGEYVQEKEPFNPVPWIFGGGCIFVVVLIILLVFSMNEEGDYTETPQDVADTPVYEGNALVSEQPTLQPLEPTAQPSNPPTLPEPEPQGPTLEELCKTLSVEVICGEYPAMLGNEEMEFGSKGEDWLFKFTFEEEPELPSDLKVEVKFYKGRKFLSTTPIADFPGEANVPCPKLESGMETFRVVVRFSSGDDTYDLEGKATVVKETTPTTTFNFGPNKETLERLGYTTDFEARKAAPYVPPERVNDVFDSIVLLARIVHDAKGTPFTPSLESLEKARGLYLDTLAKVMKEAWEKEQEAKPAEEPRESLPDFRSGIKYYTWNTILSKLTNFKDFNTNPETQEKLKNRLKELLS